MESPLALYRRYRPETFTEVIGQDHVTEPLRAALAGNRVNHAYLFSGPRGCGKTTSARILARALNCAQAPVADPCGECDSCQDLARGGPGSIDVIEIDAASHGGVDDARDLREKAFFAPVRDKYKVYIIDEAHMVTTQGFNALLKLVEEPPPHLRFIFATTEPDKVLPTIRSRTHHYPFRLIPPRLLSSYLSELCEKEQVAIEAAALPLVVRAGAGSARDTLSVLDQLMGGAGPEGVTYALASGLLGYTPDALLDDVIEAFAAGDGASVFAVVDRVIETGQDPRRFTEDLLRRLRDLVIISAVPDAPATGLIDVAEDAGERLVAQAARFGADRAQPRRRPGRQRAHRDARRHRPAAAARADLRAGAAARLRPRHRRDAGPARPPRAPRRDRCSRRAVRRAPVGRRARSRPRRRRPGAPPSPLPTPDTRSRQPEPDAGARPRSAPSRPRRRAARTPRPPAGRARPSSTSAACGPTSSRRSRVRRRLTWIHLTQHAQVVAVDGTTLTLGFSNAGARESFDGGGSAEIVRQAAIDVVGSDWKVETIVDPGAQPSRDPVAGRPRRRRPTRPPRPSPTVAVEPPATPSTTDPAAVAAAREAIQQTRVPGKRPGRRPARRGRRRGPSRRR